MSQFQTYVRLSEVEACPEHTSTSSSLRNGRDCAQCDACSRKATEELFGAHAFDVVVNLAAQAGVRYSLTHPHAYVDANITGFLNILEGCRHTNGKHLDSL